MWASTDLNPDRNGASRQPNPLPLTSEPDLTPEVISSVTARIRRSSEIGRRYQSFVPSGALRTGGAAQRRVSAFLRCETERRTSGTELVGAAID